MNDNQLIEIKKGNLKAFYGAFEAHNVKLYQYIYNRTGNAYYAEETVQLTFIRLWEKREGLSEEYSLSIQLFRIAKSILIDLSRRETRRQTRELSDMFISGPTESERLMYKEQLENVLSAIDQLPDQSRKVFQLSRLDNLSHKEIGEQLSISPKTVESHITRALKHLRKTFF
ncbi:RNA polymerase sigma factor [Puia dinghuensis]|uniref:DNA-directed RNA polymerase sigma-70 factor n=1 Tax=Puia dinghuensis TaxID=1792502 RepID=A0A8J2UJT2_9BACT|nr:sigma-70 family RNA polymerase sigma factor [Puia dinghuensis]GGB25176.1 DNA-directed RNA polymerase sigma-70 factor [Puia dinghuensis]